MTHHARARDKTSRLPQHPRAACRSGPEMVDLHSSVFEPFVCLLAYIVTQSGARLLNMRVTDF